MSSIDQFFGSGPIGDPPISGGLPSTARTLTNAIAISGAISWCGLELAQTFSGTYSDVVNYTGSGVLEFCCIHASNTLTANLRITIDGVSHTYATSGVAYSTVCPVGAIVTNAGAITTLAFAGIPYRNSLRIEISASGSTGICLYSWRKTR